MIHKNCHRRLPLVSALQVQAGVLRIGGGQLWVEHIQIPIQRHCQDSLYLADDHQKPHAAVGGEFIDQGDKNFRLKYLI
jgi:hypothetical protein